MKIATYITTLNAIFWFSTLEQTIKSALEFSDGVAVLDGGSVDGTLDLLKRLQRDYGEDKIVFEVKKCPYKELGIMSSAWRKNNARQLAINAFKPDWLMMMDDDEVFLEKNAWTLREICERHMKDDVDAIWLGTYHFYRSWWRVHGPPFYEGRVYLTKNKPEIRHDKVGTDRDALTGYKKVAKYPDIKVYHYGWCRPDHVLAIKKFRQEIDWWGVDYWKKHQFYPKFTNPDKLIPFKGDHPEVMKPLLKETWRWLPEFDERDTSLW